MDRAAAETARGLEPTNPRESSVPRGERLPDGQYVDHWVLPAEDRTKGYVRPYRESYIHVGTSPKHPLRDLTDEEQERYADCGYVKFEPYPEDQLPVTGKFWTHAQLESGCQTVTRMPRACAETYARDPKFYGSTFCCGCRGYFPVGEFLWAGTSERLGS